MTVVFLPSSIFCQIQLGGTLTGETQWDQLGLAMDFSENGQRFVVSSFLNETEMQPFSEIETYHWNGTSWEKEAPRCPQ